MIVRVYEKAESIWVGNLEDLLDANHFLTELDRRRLKALTPGEPVELDSDFRVERLEAADVPVIPRTLGLTVKQKEFYGRAVDLLTEIRMEVKLAFDTSASPPEKLELLRGLSRAANELTDIECGLTDAREGLGVPGDA